MEKSKSFKDYAYQVIDNTKKRITYTDKLPTSSEVEVYPIDFRIKIDPVKHKGYRIKTKEMKERYDRWNPIETKQVV